MAKSSKASTRHWYGKKKKPVPPPTFFGSIQSAISKQYSAMTEKERSGIRGGASKLKDWTGKHIIGKSKEPLSKQYWDTTKRTVGSAFDWANHQARTTFATQPTEPPPSKKHFWERTSKSSKTSKKTEQSDVASQTTTSPPVQPSAMPSSHVPSYAYQSTWAHAPPHPPPPTASFGPSPSSQQTYHNPHHYGRPPEQHRHYQSYPHPQQNRPPSDNPDTEESYHDAIPDQEYRHSAAHHAGYASPPPSPSHTQRPPAHPAATRVPDDYSHQYGRQSQEASGTRNGFHRPSPPPSQDATTMPPYTHPPASGGFAPPDWSRHRTSLPAAPWLRRRSGPSHAYYEEDRDGYSSRRPSHAAMLGGRDEWPDYEVAEDTHVSHRRRGPRTASLDSGYYSLVNDYDDDDEEEKDTVECVSMNRPRAQHRRPFSRSRRSPSAPHEYSHRKPRQPSIEYEIMGLKKPKATASKQTYAASSIAPSLYRAGNSRSYSSRTASGLGKRDRMSAIDYESVDRESGATEVTHSGWVGAPRRSFYDLGSAATAARMSSF